jgi:hypothetical protein
MPTIDQAKAVPMTGQVVGTVTGTLTAFGALPITSVQLIAHPSNGGVSWVISKNGAIGYPLKKDQAGVYLDAISDLSDLQGWFETANDKICWLAQIPAP